MVLAVLRVRLVLLVLLVSRVRKERRGRQGLPVQRDPLEHLDPKETPGLLVLTVRKETLALLVSVVL